MAFAHNACSRFSIRSVRRCCFPPRRARGRGRELGATGEGTAAWGFGQRSASSCAASPRRPSPSTASPGSSARGNRTARRCSRRIPRARVRRAGRAPIAARRTNPRQRATTRGRVLRRRRISRSARCRSAWTFTSRPTLPATPSPRRPTQSYSPTATARPCTARASLF